jgi:DinB superfamily
MATDPSIEPDTKDWTWVLERACVECGFDPTVVSVGDLPLRLRENTARWHGALDGDDAAVRPVPHQWSSLEYACHVRDVHRLFAERLVLMLEEDDPQFSNWDQDATAVEQRYAEQDPATVAEELVDAGEAVAALYESVGDDQWQRPGRRSNGSVFTIETLGRYHLHDVDHHLHDIGRGSGAG